MLRSWTGAPNLRRADITRSAFARVGSTQTSMSPVARGTPWTARAYAPTIRNRACAADNSRNRSAKSRFSGKLSGDGIELLAQTPAFLHALCRRERRPELAVELAVVGNAAQRATRQRSRPSFPARGHASHQLRRDPSGGFGGSSGGFGGSGFGSSLGLSGGVSPSFFSSGLSSPSFFSPSFASSFFSSFFSSGGGGGGTYSL